MFLYSVSTNDHKILISSGSNLKKEIHAQTPAHPALWIKIMRSLR
jgi:hypothetical protein